MKIKFLTSYFTSYIFLVAYNYKGTVLQSGCFVVPLYQNNQNIDFICLSFDLYIYEVKILINATFFHAFVLTK